MPTTAVFAKAAVGNRCTLVKGFVWSLFINCKSLLILLTRNVVIKHPEFINEKPLNLARTWEIWGQEEATTVFKYLKVKELGRLDLWPQVEAGFIWVNFCQVAPRRPPSGCDLEQAGASAWQGLNQGTQAAPHGWAPWDLFQPWGAVTVRSYTKWLFSFCKTK